MSLRQRLKAIERRLRAEEAIFRDRQQRHNEIMQMLARCFVNHHSGIEAVIRADTDAETFRAIERWRAEAAGDFERARELSDPPPERAGSHTFEDIADEFNNSAAESEMRAARIRDAIAKAHARLGG